MIVALTAYCKKCRREVEPGELCPVCGSRLGKNAAHAAWCVERSPVGDWMSWNAVMRILLPAALGALLLALMLEGIAGGVDAVERLFSSGLPAVLGILLGTAVVIVFLVLLLQGKELNDYVVDSRGIHETRYLTGPTPLKLLCRLQPPGMMKQVNADGAVPILKLSERHLPWREVARVQLWPEKAMVLFYAPVWWLRLPVRCTPFTWEDTLSLIREKLGKKKKVLLPPSLVTAAPPVRRRTKPQPRLVPAVEEAIEQLRMEEMMSRGDSADMADSAPVTAEEPPTD